MITVVSGNNLAASRKFLTETTLGGIQVEAGEITPEQLTQTLEFKSLFGAEKTIVINHLPKDTLVKILNEHQELPIYIWVNKNLTPAVFKKLIGFGWQIKKFNFPKTIFQFLNSLSLTDFHECLKTEPVELVFYLLHRKTSSQIAKTSQPKWLKIHRQLQEIDSQIKSGRSCLNLTARLDLLLSSI